VKLVPHTPWTTEIWCSG